jgi:exosortase E/protease (VPEID-CTERM system)
VRITLLIMIGQVWAKAAIEGFHTLAGWPFFNATALMLLIGSRTALFTPSETAPVVTRSANRAAVYLTPLVVMLATSMLTLPFARGFDILYPLHILSGGVVLWIYLGDFAAPQFRASAWALAPGAVVFVMWILLAAPANAATSNAAIASDLRHLPRFASLGWFIFRIAGAVIVMPLAEELAFRGYLLRKLVSAEFESVSYRSFTWFSFLGSSMLFALLHSNWLAGFVAGIGFALTLYRRGRLTDAIVAHSTCVRC